MSNQIGDNVYTFEATEKDGKKFMAAFDIFIEVSNADELLTMAQAFKENPGFVRMAAAQIKAGLQ